MYRTARDNDDERKMKGYLVQVRMDVEEEEKNKRLYYDKYPEDFPYPIYAQTRIVKAFKVNTETATNWSDVIAYCLGNGSKKLMIIT